MSESFGTAVIGSGPSGWACARALVARGVRVTVLDVGEKLPAERQAAVEALKWRKPAEWDADIVRLVRENPTVHTRPIPRKLSFGSDYVYGQGRAFAPTAGPVDEMSFTFACGGLSTVWGGAMLPTAEGDMVEWPFGRAALDDAYAAVLNALPLSAAHDGLEAAFPLYREPGCTVPLSPPSRRMMDRFRRNSDRLAAKGIVAGMARLAVTAEAQGDVAGCDGCGLCLSGCPRGAIWNSGVDIEAMHRAGTLRYRSGVVVTRFSEDEGGAELALLDPASGEVRSERFDRVFVACGSINTARLTLASLNLFGQPRRMHESQKFLVPMLRPDGDPGLFTETSFTLPNAVLVVRDDEDGHWSQVQISPINDLALQKLGIRPSAPAALKALVRPFLGRMVFGWGSIHSRYSAGIDLTLEPGNGAAPVLRVQPRDNPAFPLAYRRVVRRLLANAAPLGLLALPPLARLSSPGSGNHYGSVFPMRADPRQIWETDLLGRPGGMQRVHLVDATVLPSIPGTTLALPTMANAWRIGTEAPTQ